MIITYTGQVALSPVQQKKLDARFGKLAKILDGRGEKRAHVVLTTERHIHRAEITVNYYHHSLVGLESNSDPAVAMQAALDKLETQLLKLRAKWRDTTRRPEAKTKRAETSELAAAPSGSPEGKKAFNGKKPAVVKTGAKPARTEKPAGKLTQQSGGPRSVFKVDGFESRKPMTLDEAMMEMDNSDYTVYRDAATDRINVLVKRRDGNVDLIEG